MRKSIFLILIVLLLCSCSNQQTADFFAMDTFMNVKISGKQEACEEVKKLIYEMDNKFKKDNLNLDNKEIKELISFSWNVSKFTDGAFDITVSPLCDLWGFWNKEFKVPTDNEIKEALKNTGYENISFTADDIIIPEGFSIDFGGIAKGYAGDKVKELLKDRNVNSGVVTLGGNVQAIGKKPDGKKWIVGIRDPFGKKDYYGTVSVENSAVVTSGGYERFFEENGQKFEHIINPETGYPAETDIASATVISECGTLADALSTAFYVMGREKTKELCTKSKCRFENIEFSAILILEDGAVEEYGKVGLNE